MEYTFLINIVLYCIVLYCIPDVDVLVGEAGVLKCGIHLHALRVSSLVCGAHQRVHLAHVRVGHGHQHTHQEAVQHVRLEFLQNRMIIPNTNTKY